MAAQLHKWHRRIGLLAALFIVFLVITGIILQHSDGLGLPKKFLANTWLLKYYGIQPNPITTYQLGNQTISHAGDLIYLSGKPILDHTETLHGAIQVNNEIVIATSKALIIIDQNGNLIDEITTRDGLIEAPLGISLSNKGTPVIRGINTYWESDVSFTSWKELHDLHPKWVAPNITLPALRQAIEAYDMSQQISLERFLLDAHSGRVFGKYGVYVIDGAAILFLILAITGIWLWSTKKWG